MEKKQRYNSTDNTGNHFGQMIQSTPPLTVKDVFTLEDGIETIGLGVFHVKMFCIVGFLWAMEAMEFTVVSILGPELLCEWNLSSTQETILSSASFLGVFVGGPISGHIGDVYGRKTCLMFGTCWALYFAFLTAISPTFSWIVTLRFLYGIGYTTAFQCIPYLAEFMPVRSRGKAIILLNFGYMTGAALEVLLAMLVLLNSNWRWWLVASAVPLSLTLPAIYCLPESPFYHMACGRPDRAMNTLRLMATGNKINMPSGELRPETEKPRGRVRDMFSSREQSKITILSCIIWATTLFLYGGIVIITPGIINSLDTEHVIGGTGSCSLECRTLDMNDYKQVLLTTVGELPTTLLTLVLIDPLGRRWTLIAYSTLITIIMFVLALGANRLVTVILLFLARGFIGTSVLVAMVYVPEACPTVARALTVGTVTAFGKLAACFSPLVAQLLWAQSPGTALGIFCGMSAVTAIATSLLPYDTTKRPLA